MHGLNPAIVSGCSKVQKKLIPIKVQMDEGTPVRFVVNLVGLFLDLLSSAFARLFQH